MRPLSGQLRGTNFRELRARCRRLFVLPGVFSGNVQNEGDCWSVNGRLYAGDGAFPRRQSDAEATALRSDNEAALAAKRLAETQSTELTRLVTRLEAQVEELMGQRDAAGKREAGIEAARQALEKRLQTLQSTADTERERLLQHIRAGKLSADVKLWGPLLASLGDGDRACRPLSAASDTRHSRQQSCDNRERRSGVVTRPSTGR